MTRLVQLPARAARRDAPRQRGTCRPYTLLEVIIAVTLLLLVVAVMVGFGREMTRSWEKLRAEHARFRELLVLDRTVDSVLSNAVPFSWPNAEGEPALFFAGESGYLRLACLHPVTQAAEGALRFVEVFVDDGLLTVSYTERPWREPAEGEAQARTAVLAAGVDRVEFSYADWDADEAGDWGDRLRWVGEWDPERPEMPLAVQMSVYWQDGRVESWLRRMAAGYRERWGKWEPAKNE